MAQSFGKIVKILPDGLAKIEVVRVSACTGECASCGGCSGEKPPIIITLPITTQKQGERVELVAENRRIFSQIALVYILPVVFMIVAYIFAQNLGEGVATAISISALALGILTTFVISKSIKAETSWQVKK